MAVPWNPEGEEWKVGVKMCPSVGGTEPLVRTATVGRTAFSYQMYSPAF